MPISTGDKLGPYEILSLLGKGGMGEVYKARDPRLDRVVAIKVSHAEFSERFEREARSIAALNHPNVCQLYDVGHNYLVMEFVEGSPIAPPDTPRKLLDIAVQIADGLAAAHAAGIVHRDLKPDNILITGDGRVKILDFGLAKAAAGASGSDDATQSIVMSLTDAGTTLGTIAYMSPEQARGQTNLTPQSDQFSFGLVLYEMAAGKRAFQRGSAAETMTAIIREEAEPLPASVPAHLRWIVERLLSKEPAERYDSSRDLHRELRQVRERMSESMSASVIAVSAMAPRTSTRHLAKTGWLAAGVLALAAAALAFLHFRETPAAIPLLQAEMPLPDDANPRNSAISPDGTALVVNGVDRGGRSRLYFRPLSAREFSVIPGSENSSHSAFWSPDSQWIAFGLNGRLMKWKVTGGQPPQVICNANVRIGGSWGEDDVIVFDEIGKPIQRVPAAGGVPRNALELDAASGEKEHISPSFMPGGKAFVFISNGKVRGAQYFATLDGKVRRHLFENSSSWSVWAAKPSGGYLAWVKQSQLFVRPINPVTGELEREEVLLADGVSSSQSFSFSRNGYLAYRAIRVASAQLRWYGRDGKPGELMGEPGPVSAPRLSPDGKRMTFLRRNAGKSEIWLAGADGGSGERVAGGPALGRPMWTPEGHILYSRWDATGSVLIEKPADALAAETIIAHFAGNALTTVDSISADGKVIALNAGGAASTEVFVVSRPGGVVRSTEFNSGRGVVSPDGRWLAQMQSSPGKLLVRAIPADLNTPLPADTRELASFTAQASQFRWGADGRELFVFLNKELLSLPIVWHDGTPRAGTVRKLFDVPHGVSFDVSADGKRFLFSESEGEAAIPPMVIVQNWPALLPK